MTDEFENELRRLMRPVEAPDGLTERIMAALPPKAMPATVTSIASGLDSSRAGSRRAATGCPAPSPRRSSERCC